MRHAALLALGTALCFAAPAMAQTQTTKALGGDRIAPVKAKTYDHTKPYPAYTAPRLKIGQPDLQGVWSNASLTPQARPAAQKDIIRRASSIFNSTTWSNFSFLAFSMSSSFSA